MSCFPLHSRSLNLTTSTLSDFELNFPEPGNVLIKVDSIIVHPEGPGIEGTGTVVKTGIYSWRLDSQKVIFFQSNTAEYSTISQYIITSAKSCVPVSEISTSLYNPLIAMMLKATILKRKSKTVLHYSLDRTVGNMLEKTLKKCQMSVKLIEKYENNQETIENGPVLVLVGYGKIDSSAFNSLPENSELIVYKEKCDISGINPSEIIFHSKKISGVNVNQWFFSLGMEERYKVLHFIQKNSEIFSENFEEIRLKDIGNFIGERFDRKIMNVNTIFEDFDEIIEKRSTKLEGDGSGEISESKPCEEKINFSENSSGKKEICIEDQEIDTKEFESGQEDCDENTKNYEKIQDDSDENNKSMENFQQIEKKSEINDFEEKKVNQDEDEKDSRPENNDPNKENLDSKQENVDSNEENIMLSEQKVVEGKVTEIPESKLSEFKSESENQDLSSEPKDQIRETISLFNSEYDDTQNSINSSPNNHIEEKSDDFVIKTSMIIDNESVNSEEIQEDLQPESPSLHNSVHISDYSELISRYSNPIISGLYQIYSAELESLRKSQKIDEKNNLLGPSAKVLGDQSVYIGTFNQNNELQGFGERFYPDGSIFAGNWENSIINGYGLYIFSDLSLYIGEWKNGEHHGKGKIITKIASITKQDTEENKNRVNGSIFSAKFENLTIKSLNLYVFPDFSVFEGEWENGQYHGHGKLITCLKKKISNKNKSKFYCEVYEGLFERGLKNGWGTLTQEKSGLRYVGMFRLGKIHGEGTIFLKDIQFKGQFLEKIEGIIEKGEHAGKEISFPSIEHALKVKNWQGYLEKLQIEN